MPPIRMIFFTILAIMLMVYGAMLFTGGYETSNGLQMSNTIQANYNAISSASALPGGFAGNVTGLGVAVNNSASKVNSSAGSSSAIPNSVAMVYNFLTTIPNVIGAIVGFVAMPISTLGVPIGYAQIIVSIMFLGIIGLSIISAIFLFPIAVLP